MANLPDYEVYLMDSGEKIRYQVFAALSLFAVGMVFFNNPVISTLLAIGSYWYPKYKTKDLILKRRVELNLQFKDALHALASSLSAGKSLENAFKSALGDLRILYPDEKSYIIAELEYICRRIELNEPIETALTDFARRSGIDDIKNFADVIVICKRSGGNLVQVVKNTAGIISEKIEISQSIEVQLTKQRYEQKLLNAMPVIFIGLIRFGGDGYMDSLYTAPLGYLLMAVALLILAGSYFLSRKIFDIKV